MAPKKSEIVAILVINNEEDATRVFPEEWFILR